MCKMHKNKDKQSKIGVFLRGFLMGVCDTIPGISGGTIAFITGIYIRLIESIKAITKINNFKLLSKSVSKFIEKTDVKFLSILVIGIITAILTTANIVSFLLENYLALTLSFFIGLILLSLKSIYKDIPSHSLKNISFILIGFLLGSSLLLLSPSTISNPDMLLVIFAGFIAVSALFLPGISGSFILLIIGLYKYIIDAVKTPLENISNIALFIIGAGIGAIVISRIVDFLYKVDKSKTLYTLIGVVAGSMLIPVSKVTSNLPGMLTQETLASILLVVIGGMVVELLHLYTDYNKS